MNAEEELKSFTVHCLKMFLKTVKPWKKRPEAYEFDEGKNYADGWNDCIREMKKNGDRYISHIEQIFP